MNSRQHVEIMKLLEDKEICDYLKTLIVMKTFPCLEKHSDTERALNQIVEKVKPIYAITDKTQALQLVQRNGLFLAFLNPSLINEDISIAAIRQNPDAIMFTNADFVRSFLATSPLSRIPIFMNAAITAQPDLIKNLSDEQATILRVYRLRTFAPVFNNRFFTQLDEHHSHPRGLTQIEQPKQAIKI